MVKEIQKLACWVKRSISHYNHNNHLNQTTLLYPWILVSLCITYLVPVHSESSHFLVLYVLGAHSKHIPFYVYRKKSVLYRKIFSSVFCGPNKIVFLTYLKNNPPPFGEKMPIVNVVCKSIFPPRFKEPRCTILARNQILMGITSLKIRYNSNDLISSFLPILCVWRTKQFGLYPIQIYNNVQTEKSKQTNKKITLEDRYRSRKSVTKYQKHWNVCVILYDADEIILIQA